MPIPSPTSVLTFAMCIGVQAPVDGAQCLSQLLILIDTTTGCNDLSLQVFSNPSLKKEVSLESPFKNRATLFDPLNLGSSC